MATWEDKILGEKKHYYCSSSEDSGGEDDSDDGKEASPVRSSRAADGEARATLQEVNKWDGVSSNTGPKGVIRDWQRYKQLETEKRQENEMERLNLAKKLCLAGNKPVNQDEEDDELMALADDAFMEEFRKKRMNEISKMLVESRPKFGKVILLGSGNDFLDAIDKEDKSVTVIVHLYEESVPACKMMNRCLDSLSRQYTAVKFCKMVGSRAGMSQRFKVDGVPALLVYKEGQVIGNFVRVTDELGMEFFDGDVENFLIEQGILLDRHCIPEIIERSQQEEDEGSDWSIE